MSLYLDYNASAPIISDVIEIMNNSIDIIGNPSSIHSSGRKAKKAIEDSREIIAETIDTNPKNIIFTSGATEANTLALNCSKEMIKLHNKTKGSVIATKRVERKTVSRWGILSIKNKKKSHFEIKDVVEKPSIKKAPSNFAIIGRYILSSKIFNEIKKLKPGQGGELHITDAIKNLINKDNKFYGNIFKGTYLDCGTLEGYINSGLKINKR